MAKDLRQCHPELQEKAKELQVACAAVGLPIGIADSYRTAAEQDALYALGRTQPGSIVTNAKGSDYDSMHQWGVAFDFYRNDGKGAYNNNGQYFEKVGQIGKALGLEWGGDWKSPVDRPHFQLPDWGSTASTLKKRYGTVSNFKKTWSTYDPPTSSWVRRLQQELTRQGYDPGKDDGIPGPKTLAACPTLREGASGGITRLVQERLANDYKIGLGASGVDGVFGTATKAAVMEFQRQKGLTIDGIVGKNTWRALLGL